MHTLGSMRLVDRILKPTLHQAFLAVFHVRWMDIDHTSSLPVHSKTCILLAKPNEKVPRSASLLLRVLVRVP